MSIVGTLYFHSVSSACIHVFKYPILYSYPGPTILGKLSYDNNTARDSGGRNDSKGQYPWCSFQFKMDGKGIGMDNYNDWCIEQDPDGLKESSQSQHERKRNNYLLMLLHK